MKIDLKQWYKTLAPRTTVLVSTVDKKGISNAAPFSFVMPVSVSPPVIAIAMVSTRHTLSNIRAMGDFVVNVPGEKVLSQLWYCAKALPKGVSEIKEAKLTEQKAVKIKSPRIKECFCWYECKLRDEIRAGDHIIVLGDIVYAEGKEGKESRALLHVGGSSFALAGKFLKAE